MSTLAGTGALARLDGRRDRIMLPAWIYVLTALVAGTAYSFKKLYPSASAGSSSRRPRPTIRRCSRSTGRCTATRSAR